MLTQDRLKALLNYDSETGIFTWRHDGTYKIKSGSIAGCKDSFGYIKISIHGEPHKAHRLAFLYMTGKWPADSVDHINHIKDDNRWCNLREATYSENSANRKDNIIVKYNGVDMLLKKACLLQGIKYQTVRTRLRNFDCTPLEALMIPSAGRGCDTYANSFKNALERYRKENNL